jgi:hypothetical protein
MHKDILEITAKDNTANAVLFTGTPSDGLLDILCELGLEFVDDLEGTPEAGTRCFIDGDTDEDTVAIFPGYYFVQYGPFWDVMSAEQFVDEFKLVIE